MIIKALRFGISVKDIIDSLNGFNIFYNAGISAIGVPYQPPRFIFWNLSENKDFPAFSCQPNVAFFSGYNSSILNILASSHKKYEIKNKNGIKYLYVRTKDIYFSLPAKIIMALEAFLQMPEFSQYSHFYKIDDDCKINWDRIKTGYPIEFKNHIDKNPYSGGVIFKDKGRRWNANRHQKYASQDPTNYWATNNYTGDGINYLRGSNYVLRRDLIKKINKIWKFSSKFLYF